MIYCNSICKIFVIFSGNAAFRATSESVGKPGFRHFPERPHSPTNTATRDKASDGGSCHIRRIRPVCIRHRSSAPGPDARVGTPPATATGG